MNRRKIFGILAAPVAAASIPVKSEVKSDLKPYSAFDYGDIHYIWYKEYMRKACGHSVSDLYACRGVTGLGSGDVVHIFVLPGGGGFSEVSMRAEDLRQAFADACLNGEVPGVWWE